MAGFDDITMDDINSTTGGDPVEAVGEPAAAEAPPAAEPAPASATHPWDADLGFVPEEHRGAVSEYLATSWQPRMTQYEQDLKEWQDAFGGDAERRDVGSRVVDAFADDPQLAFIQLGVEMGFLDPGDLGEGWEEYASIFEDATGLEAPESPSGLSAEQEELLAWAQAKKAEEDQSGLQSTLHEYYREVAAKYGIAKDFDLDTFDVMFGGTMGDEEKAVALYKATKRSEAPATIGDPAPPVLNDSTGGMAPAEEEHYDSFEDATKALLAEARAKEGR